MIQLLLLAFAAHLPATGVAGMPGDAVDIPVLLVGDEDVQLQASGALRGEQDVQIDGKHAATLHARIAPNAQPGTYTSHVYVKPDSDSPVVAATALPITTTVEQRSTSSHAVAGTSSVFSQHAWWVVGAAALIAIITILLAAVRIERR